MKAKVLAAALLMALTTTTALAQGQQGRGSKEQSVRIERRDIKKGAKAPMVKKEMQKRARHDGRRDFAQCQQCRKGHRHGRQFCHHHGHQHRHQQAQVIIIRV